MKTENINAGVMENKEPGPAYIYDTDKVEQIRRFLDTDIQTTAIHSEAIDTYGPQLYDYESKITVMVSDNNRQRFIMWYKSSVCVKMLITFEENYLCIDIDSRATYANQSFLIDYVISLRALFYLANLPNDFVIHDKTDFKYFVLFFEQIETFMINQVKQTVPLSFIDLRVHILKTFYDLCNDITEISSFEDISKIMDIELERFVLDFDKSSLVFTGEYPDLFTFSTNILDKETKKSAISNFPDENYEDWALEMKRFLDDPMFYRKARFYTEPF